MNELNPISLTEMDEVKLLNRTDTKFIFRADFLPEFLRALKDDYFSLQIGDKRIANYNSVYFDTAEFKHYFDHHNGRPSRIKIRKRSYIDSNLHFIEIKHKYKGRTIKHRTTIDSIDEVIDEKLEAFIQSKVPYEKVNASIWNSFKRITLVNKDKTERLTIDLDLTFKMGSFDQTFDNLVICEVKQGKKSRTSKVIQVLKENGIRPSRISKYCVGISLLHPNIKSNKFKPKLLKINKLSA